MDGYFGHLTEKLPGNNPIFSAFQACCHCVVPPCHSYNVTSNSNGIQGICLRGARDENPSTYTCDLQKEQQKLCGQYSIQDKYQSYLWNQNVTENVKASLTQNGMGSEKSMRYRGWIPTPPPPPPPPYFHCLKTKFGSMKVCHKFYSKP